MSVWIVLCTATRSTAAVLHSAAALDSCALISTSDYSQNSTQRYVATHARAGRLED
jgi:hypothetical protein